MSISVSLSGKELNALQEADPFLIKLYVFGIRRYMDYETAIVGVRRHISWQSLAEECYIAPRSGVKKNITGLPHKSQIRRGVETLKSLGLLMQMNNPRYLIFECLLATSDKSVQIQVGIEADIRADTKGGNKKNNRKPVMTRVIGKKMLQVDTQADAQVDVQADTPPSTDITDININISCRFSEFWNVYPRKEKKKDAQRIWKTKNLNAKADQIISDVQNRKARHKTWLDGYVPHATTYLNGDRWEDEITEVHHDQTNQRNNGTGGKSSSIARAVNSYIRNKRSNQQRALPALPPN